MPFTTEEIELMKSAKSRGLDANQTLEVLNGYRADVLKLPPIGQPAPKEATDAQKLLNAEPKKKGFLGRIIGSASSGTGIIGVGEGILQGLGRTFAGAAELGTHAGEWVGEKLGTNPNGVTKGPTISSDLNQLLTPVTGAQKFGFGAEKVGEFVAPANIVGKAAIARNLGKGATLGLNALGQGAVGAGVASVQEGKVGKETAISGIIGAGAPLVGAGLKEIARPAKALVSRLFTNLSANMAGKPAEVLRSIGSNVLSGKATEKIIMTSGQEKVLQKNVSTIMDGVTKIRKEAGAKFASALDDLKKTDINPSNIKTNGLSSLEKFGIKIKGGKIDLSNAEFTDPKNITKAKNLINKVNNIKSLDGKSLRKIIDDVESNAYSVATTDERLSFNMFVKDLANKLREAVAKTTPVLEEASKAYSKDRQLVDAIQKIFGKVKFKNTDEINQMAKKLEGLFDQKGLDPKTVQDFFTRIGGDSSEFYASEGVRQLSTAGNQSGSGVLQSLSKAIVNPSNIGSAVIKAKQVGEALNKVLSKIPASTSRLIPSILQSGMSDRTQEGVQTREQAVNEAVQTLQQQGINDPIQVLQYLNYNSAGKKVNNLRMKDIEGILQQSSSGGIVDEGMYGDLLQ